MAQLDKGKYSLAWFKLAEFVLRKEKERALGIYRLLSYSLQDEGLALQLEGDLLLSFSDAKAIDAYLKAAKIYEAKNQLMQAVAIFEHLSLLQPDKFEHKLKKLKLYINLNNDVKIAKANEELAISLTEKHKLDYLNPEILGAEIKLNYIIDLYQHVILKLAINKLGKNSYKHLDNLLELLLKDNSQLQLFLSKLSQLDGDAHSYSINFLKN